MRVAGIDVSTFAVDIVTVPYDDESHGVRWHRHILKGNDAFDRSRTVGLVVPGPNSEFWDDIVAVGIENPQARGPAAQNISVLHRVVGAVLTRIPQRMLVEPLQPAEWRKACGLKGNATKTDVAGASGALLLELEPLESYSVRPEVTDTLTGRQWPQDAHDAHLIARATRTLLRQSPIAA